MKKLLITLLTLLLTFCALVGLTACEEPEPQAPEIDYSKYNYYGNYSFRSNLSNGGTLELNFKLGKDNKYEMTLDVYSVNGLRLVDVMEEGSYSMSTLDEPIFDETMNVIYMLSLTPYLSTGFANYESVYGFYGYITQGFYMDYWWYYIDHYQYGASVYFGKDGNQYKAEYSKLEYSVTYLAGVGGAIDGYVNQGIAEGEDGVEVTAVADYGYIFDSWSDGVTTATRKETNVNGDITVTANFVEYLPKYTLTYTCTDGGTLQGALSQTLFQGLDGTTVTAVPEDRFGKEDYPYQFIEWSDGVKTAERTDLNVQGDITVTAIFKPQYSYYGQVEEGAGRVETLTNTANHANNFTVTATAIASEGWVFVEWTDGVKDSTRTDVLTNDLMVEAIFAKEFKLIAKQGGKITVNGQTDTELTLLLRLPLAGELNTVAEAIADSGYTVYGWSKYEDGHWLDSYNAYLSIDYYSNNTTYYALFNEVIQGGGSGSNEDGEQGGGSGSNEDGEQGGGSGSNEDGEQGGGSGSNEDGEQGGGSGSNEDGEQGGGSGSNEDGDQNEDKPIYELEYVYSEELQGYSVAGIKLSESSQLLYDVVIPSTYRSVAVKGIDKQAFFNELFLRSIEIPEGVEKIGSDAFSCCSSLEKLQLPSTIVEISPFAFRDCNNLKDINLPEGILSIPYYCFAGCQSLTQINIPSTVLSIGERAFSGCSSLQSVNLNSVSIIGYCVFEGCVNLKSITIPDTVATCGYDIFKDCEGLSKVYIDSAVFANSMDIGYYLKYTTDVYVRTDIETTVSIYSMAYNLLSTEEIDGVEYYHYQIKE